MARLHDATESRLLPGQVRYPCALLHARLLCTFGCFEALFREYARICPFAGHPVGCEAPRGSGGLPTQLSTESSTGFGDNWRSPFSIWQVQVGRFLRVKDHLRRNPVNIGLTIR